MMESSVLVVDDSPTFRGIVSITLEKSGSRVTQACDGLEACALLPDAHYDLFIVDINMPRMNGIELIHEIRKHDRHKETPIIVLSSQDGPDLESKVKDQGVLHWMVKPFTPVELLDKVAHILA